MMRLPDRGELERLTSRGIPLMDRRNTFEFCCKHLTELSATLTGSFWRPLSGSLVHRRALTAERIYHLPGGHDCDRVHIYKAVGERWFCSDAEAEAVAAGWRKAGGE